MNIPDRERERVTAAYKDKKLPGAFSGSATFYRSLKKTGRYPSLTYLQTLDILSKIPSYSIHLRKRKLRFQRHVDYDRLSVGSSMQADLAEFPQTEEGIKYALVMVDVMDNYCYTKELPNKTARAVQKAFLFLKKKYNLQRLSVIATDEGGEFKGSEAFFKKQNIKLIYLGRNTKAFKVRGLLHPRAFS